jgi:hypothetical protein
LSPAGVFLFWVVNCLILFALKGYKGWSLFPREQGFEIHLGYLGVLEMGWALAAVHSVHWLHWNCQGSTKWTGQSTIGPWWNVILFPPPPGFMTRWTGLRQMVLGLALGWNAINGVWTRCSKQHHRAVGKQHGCVWK